MIKVSELAGPNPKIPVFEGPNAEKVFFCMALDMVKRISDNNQRGEKTAFIVPVGPVGEYPYFVRLVNTLRVSLANVWFFNMDEYLTDKKEWVDISHPLSFRGFMQKNVYDKIDPELVMPPEQRVFPDPRDPGNVARVIERAGGVDVCYGGLGVNGHIAFNEPEDVPAEEYAEHPTRILDISQTTRTVNGINDLGGRIDDMPKYCVSVGMKEIIAARAVRMYCFRSYHKAVVVRAACGEVSSLFPVTLMQRHPDASITFAVQTAD